MTIKTNIPDILELYTGDKTFKEGEMISVTLSKGNILKGILDTVKPYSLVLNPGNRGCMFNIMFKEIASIEHI